MSARQTALDELLNELTTHYNDPLGIIPPARAELAALRDDSLLLIGSNRLLSEIGAALGCAPDATILDSISELRATVAEQARQLQAANRCADILNKLNTGMDVAIPKNNLLRMWARMKIDDALADWLAAYPAPQPQAEEKANV